MERPEKGVIYGYDDFRAYLRDCYEARQASEPSLSCRKFAAEAGFTNPGYFNDVLKSRRRLSAAAIEKVLRVFGLSPQESEFFRLLVAYGQCKESVRRQELYRQVLARRNRSAFTRLNPAQTRYFQDHRYWLVWGAIEVLDFRGNYEELGRFLEPPLPAAAIKKYVRDLCEWGLVRQKADGKYQITDAIVEPPPTLKEMIRNLQREWISLARDALARVPPSKRHISTTLLNISETAHRQILEEVESFREKVFAILKSDRDPRRIMQLNIQYFPHSREERERR